MLEYEAFIVSPVRPVQSLAEAEKQREKTDTIKHLKMNYAFHAKRGEATQRYAYPDHSAHALLGKAGQVKLLPDGRPPSLTCVAVFLN